MSPAPATPHPSRIVVPPSAQGPRRVVVKFRDGVFVPYEDGAQAHLTGEVANLWAHLTSHGQFATLRLDRLFTSTSVARIKDLVVLARHTDPGYVSPPDFLTYFVVDCPELAIASQFVDSLTRSALVERAYVQAPPAPLPSPSVDPSNDPRYPDQWYLQPATRGINAPYAWAREKGAGQGVTFADIEAAWTLDHVDLLNQDGTRRVALEQFSVNHDVAGDRAHGTAALGVVMATDNDKGCVGVAPWPSKALAIGEHRLSASAAVFHNRPDAILRAVDLLGYGDVLLLELQFLVAQTSLPLSQIPCELDPETSPGEGRTAYDLIRLATALGIAVIEPAGNGEYLRTAGVRLDGGTFARFTRRDPAFQDSGAIVVAAATAGVTRLHRRTRPRTPTTAPAPGRTTAAEWIASHGVRWSTRWVGTTTGVRPTRGISTARRAPRPSWQAWPSWCRGWRAACSGRP